MTSPPGRGEGDVLTNKYIQSHNQFCILHISYTNSSHIPGLSPVAWKNVHILALSQRLEYLLTLRVHEHHKHKHTQRHKCHNRAVVLPVPVPVHRPQFGQHWHQSLHASVAVCLVSQCSSITPIMPVMLANNPL